MKQQVKLEDIRDISNEHYLLRTVSYSKQKKDGTWEKFTREIYDHGDAATVLLYNKQKRTIILVEQFRIVVFLDKNPSGMLLETCAGLLDGEDAQTAITREIEEETGYRISDVKQVYAAYSSAGAYTEKLYFFIAEYNESQQVSKGGGLEEEQEELEVIEMAFDDAVNQLKDGKIVDIKTIVLLQYALVHNLFND